MRSAWEEALAADRPVVLEVKTDPEIPPLPAAHPGRAGEEDGRSDGQGRPERTGVMEKSLRGKLVEFTEHLKR
jgi:pyruvate dehydrogenase (quinone)